MSDLCRFHVQIGTTKRSTVSLPRYLLIMFSIKNDFDLLDQKGLHKKIRDWCQQTLYESHYDEYAINYSQFLQNRMTEEIMDKEISTKYSDLFTNDNYDKIKF